MRFHDGSPFDAAAAKFSLERILAAGSINPQRSRLRSYTRGRSTRSSHAEGAAQPPLRGIAAVAGLRLGSDGVAAIRREQRGCSPSARARSDSCAGGAAIRSPWSAIRRTRGTRAALGQVTFKFIIRPNRRLCRADGRRCRCFRQLSCAGEFCPICRRSAFCGIRRNHGDGDGAGAE